MDKKKLEQRRIEKNMKKLAAQMQQVGAKTPVKVPELDFTEAAREAQSKKFDDPSLEAEAVLSFLNRPARYLLKKCQWCKQPFGTNYHAVAYCSDACRAKAIRSQTGIVWNPHKSPEERWGGEPPSIIPPAAMMALLKFARKNKHLVEDPQIQTETQVQQYYEEQGLMSQSETIPPVAQEQVDSEQNPIHDEVAYVSQSEKTEPEQSEPEHTDSPDVQEESPETTSPLPQTDTTPQVNTREEDFVFDFE